MLQFLTGILIIHKNTEVIVLMIFILLNPSSCKDYIDNNRIEESLG